MIGIVLLTHVAALASWASSHRISALPHEMSVSVRMSTPPQAAPVIPEPQPVRQAVAKAKTIVQPRAETTHQVVATAPAAVVETPYVAASTPALPDREPDFQAAYLNNPVPAYPMVARRMAWQGKVIISVEVLASGVAGQVKLYQSSGHDVLDNAALQAVRGWKFSAARQAGQLVNKWFLVPIPFILKEIE
jgi:protein TonB